MSQYGYSRETEVSEEALLDLYHHPPPCLTRLQPSVTKSGHLLVFSFAIAKLLDISGASNNPGTGTCRVEARFVCTRQLPSAQDHHHSSSQLKSPFPPYPFPPGSPSYLRLILIPDTP